MVAEKIHRRAFESPIFSDPNRPDSKLWKLGLKTIERFGGKRGKLVMGVYCVMRILDDYANGDRNPPEGKTPEEYIAKKREFIANLPGSEKTEDLADSGDDLDQSLIACTRFAYALNIDIREELGDFFTYFTFDVGRLGKDKVCSQSEIREAYLGCQKATIRGLLKVTNQNADIWELFLPLADAVFIHYTLRDWEEDREKGLVNIPYEAYKRLDVTRQDLSNRFAPSIRAWFWEQANLGLDLLKQQESNFKEDHLPWLAKSLIPFMYVRPAKRYFEAVLEGKKS